MASSLPVPPGSYSATLLRPAKDGEDVSDESDKSDEKAKDYSRPKIDENAALIIALAIVTLILGIAIVFILWKV